MPRQPNTKLYGYVNAFYAHCLENSEEKVIDGNAVNVWSGFIGKTCRELKIPAGMDRRVIKPLEELGCITYVQRGAGQWPSVVVLHYPPTADVWESEDGGKPLTRRVSFDILCSEVEEIKRSIGGGNIVAALKSLDERISKLESSQRR